jgi:hypothetical protein
MDKRAEARGDLGLEEKQLALNLRKALKGGKVDYVLVKADATPDGKYAGYQMKQFKIDRPGGN